MRQLGPSPDAAPDLVDARVTSPDAAGSFDGTSDRGGPDATVTSECGSLVSFHVEQDLSVDPTTVCDECGGPMATLTSGTTQIRVGSWLGMDTTAVWVTSHPINSCALACDTCQPIFCHSCVILSPAPTTGLDVAWDGSYYLQGTCNGNACMGPTACAPAGHWVAKFCMPRGVTVRGPYRSGACMPLSKLDPSPTRIESCGTAEFDLPSVASLSVKIRAAAGTRVPLDPGLARAVLGLAGSYRLGTSSGTMADEAGPTKVQFADVDLLVAGGIDSDLVVTTNPLPGDFPGSCTIPVNVAIDGAGNWSLQNPATTCASDGATVTLYPGYYKLSPSGPNLAVVAAGSSTGGSRSATETFAFAYSGLALRSP
jgi:hypothetical protein